MSTAIEVLKLLDEPAIVAMLRPPMAVDFRALLKIIKGPTLPDAMNPCGKQWFRSKDEAEKDMAENKRHSTRGPKYILNAYYCHDCDGFHVGHTRRKKR